MTSLKTPEKTKALMELDALRDKLEGLLEDKSFLEALENEMIDGEGEEEEGDPENLVIPVPLKRLSHGKDIELPAYATTGSVGADLCAAIETPLTLRPGERHLVPTGFAIALPQGVEAQIRSRSGLALKHGLAVLNSPGTIDQDYHGELKVILINHGTEAVTITRGMRIAQLVIAPVVQAFWDEEGAFPSTSERGEGGFGSTGV